MINYKEIYEKSFDDQNYNQHPDNEFRFKIVEDFVLSNNTFNLCRITKSFANDSFLCHWSDNNGSLKKKQS
mgnify:CR=1 FL=1